MEGAKVRYGLWLRAMVASITSRQSAKISQYFIKVRGNAEISDTGMSQGGRLGGF